MVVDSEARPLPANTGIALTRHKELNESKNKESSHSSSVRVYSRSYMLQVEYIKYMVVYRL